MGWGGGKILVSSIEKGAAVSCYSNCYYLLLITIVSGLLFFCKFFQVFFPFHDFEPVSLFLAFLFLAFFFLLLSASSDAPSPVDSWMLMIVN